MASRQVPRREFLEQTLVFTVASLPFLYAAKSHAGENAPNFVFILSDDQGWTGSSVSMDNARGDAKSDYFLTPNLERLAGQGVWFTQGYTPAALG